MALVHIAQAINQVKARIMIFKKTDDRDRSMPPTFFWECVGCKVESAPERDMGGVRKEAQKHAETCRFTER